jgi:hypothetical protein
MRDEGVLPSDYFLITAKRDDDNGGAKRAAAGVAHKLIHRNCELLRATVLSCIRHTKSAAIALVFAAAQQTRAL